MTALLVTGTRHEPTREERDRVLSLLREAMVGMGGVLFVGDCPTGIDALARRVAAEELWTLAGDPARGFVADWTAHGKAAGPRRNALMVADYVTHCADCELSARALAFPAETVPSRVTMDCVTRLARNGVRIDVHPVEVQRV